MFKFIKQKLDNKIKKRLLFYFPELRKLNYLNYLDDITFQELKNRTYNCHLSTKSKINAPYFLNKCQLGDYSYIARNSIVSNTKIGKFCSIGPNFVAGYGIHPTRGISTSPMFYSTIKQNGMSLSSEDKVVEHLPISIKNDVLIGANVTCLDGVTIGNGAIIGAGAVVVNDIPEYAIAVGVPARVIKYRFNTEEIEKLKKINWWTWNETQLKEIEKYFFKLDDFLKKYSK